MHSEMWEASVFDSTSGSTAADFVRDEPIEEQAFFRHPHYEDLGPISRGAFGDVRRVRDTRSACVLAMKIMRRSIAAESRPRIRFATEIEIMTSLQHRGILPAHDHGELDDGRLWLTMPEVRGRTFALVLDELDASVAHDVCQSAPFRRALRSFAHLCLVVDFAHHQGIVHRDLKPKNMMVADDAETFVIDWGVAKRMTATAYSGVQNPISFTEPGEVLGTPAYMPPEQASGDIASQSLTSDVYSLGAVLYHLLTGQPPYRGPRAAVLARIKRAPPPPILAVVPPHRIPPTELVALCDAAMQRDPSKRIASARRMAQAVLEWLDESL